MRVPHLGTVRFSKGGVIGSVHTSCPHNENEISEELHNRVSPNWGSLCYYIVYQAKYLSPIQDRAMMDRLENRMLLKDYIAG